MKLALGRDGEGVRLGHNAMVEGPDVVWRWIERVLA